MKHSSGIYKVLAGWLLFYATGIIISHTDFLLFHSLIELFGVFVSLSITTIACTTFYITNLYNRFTLLGVAYGVVALFGLFHVLTFKGIGIFPIDTTSIGVQFSTISKYMECLTLLGIPILFAFGKKISFTTMLYICSAVSILLTLLVLAGPILPAFIINEATPSLVKRINEAIILFLLVLIIIAMSKSGRMRKLTFFKPLLLSLSIKTASQLCFVLSFSLFDTLSISGHIFRCISYYYIYKAVVASNLKAPLDTLYMEIRKKYEQLEEKNLQLTEINLHLNQEIDHRHKVEAELLQSEERYRQLFELLPDGVFVSNHEKVILANNSLAKLFGADSPDEIVGRRGSEIVTIHPDYQQIVSERKNSVLSDSTNAPLKEQKIIKKDGTVIDVEIAAAPFPLKENTAMLAVVRDISERKKLESLQLDYAESTKLLKEALEGDRMKTEFFANISHELRTPLNVILGTLQLYELYINRNVPLTMNYLRKNTTTMQQNCRRLLRLVNNLIDTTKIDAGYLELQLQNHNIVSVVEEITLSVVGYIKDRGIELQFDTDTEERILACDPDKIERIILNLLSNSIKFTKAGGNITVRIYDGESTLKISIKDTGIGIPKDKQELIFERFKQVDKSLTRSHEGSGIGLSLVKSLVEMHKGKISVNSEFGHGSEFVIELPVSTLPEENQPNTAAVRTVNERIEKINVEFSDIYRVV